MSRSSDQDFELPMPKRRRRPAKSCTPCRERKVKCDQQEPCGPCRKARATLTCIYKPEIWRVDSSIEQDHQQSSSLSKTIVQLQSRLAKLEKSTKHLGGEESTIRKALGDLEKRIADIEDNQGLVNCVHGGKSASPPALSVPPLTPYLRVTAEKSKLFDGNHWIHTAAKFVVGGIQQNQVEINLPSKVGFGKALNDVRKMRSVIKAHELPVLDNPLGDILLMIPDKQTCDRMVDAYLRTCEGLYRILHIPSFREEYDNFWVDQNASTTLFRMKLILILSIGHIFLETRSEREKFSAMSKSWVAAAQWWLTGPDRRLTINLDDIQVACLIQLARQMTSMSMSWAFVGTLVQMAFATGLHRDPSTFSALPPFQIAMRRRLWATVLGLHLQATVDGTSGPPLAIFSYDTKPPLNYNDSDLTPGMTVLPVEKSKEIYTDSSIQRLLHETASLRLRIANLLGGLSQPHSYTTAIESSDQIKEACIQATAFFGEASTVNTDSQIIPSIYHEQSLSILLHRQILLIHRRFALEKAHDSQYYSSRKLCLDSAIVIASSILDMDVEKDNMNDLCRVFTASNGPMTGPLNLMIITTIGLELVTQLNERATVSKAMLCATQEPILEILRQIQTRYRHLIQRGRPNLKRYGLVSAIILQIQALQTGEDATQGFLKWAKETVPWIVACLENKTDSIYHERSATQVLTDMQFDDFNMAIFGGSDGFTFDMSALLNYSIGDSTIF